MANGADGGAARWNPWRIAGWSIPVLLLLLPLAAMQFTSEVNWTGSDFAFAAVLFAGVGLAFEFIVRRSRSLAYRLGAGAAVITAFLTVWINAAVGMIGSEDNAYNLLFGGVLLTALLGVIAARLEARGMVVAMIVAALAQVGLGAGGIGTDPRGAVLSISFGGLWLLAAALFWSAARQRRTVEPS